jgi:excisionase family DNA binding protein
VVTEEEAAERLRFSTETILTWIKQGKLPAHHVENGKGARWRISRRGRGASDAGGGAAQG